MITHPLPPGGESTPPSLNRYGVDVSYFLREMSALVGTLDNRPPDELARYFRRLADVAAPGDPLGGLAPEASKEEMAAYRAWRATIVPGPAMTREDAFWEGWMAKAKASGGSGPSGPAGLRGASRLDLRAFVSQAHFLITMAALSEDGVDGDDCLKWMRRAEAHFPHLIRQEIPEDSDLTEPKPEAAQAAPEPSEAKGSPSVDLVHAHHPGCPITEGRGQCRCPSPAESPLDATPSGAGDLAQSVLKAAYIVSRRFDALMQTNINYSNEFKAAEIAVSDLRGALDDYSRPRLRLRTQSQKGGEA